MTKRRRKEGFSLVELIIIMGIIAILVGFSALGLGYMKSADTKSVVNGINGGLTQLKSQVMAKSKPVYMYLYLDEDSYYLVYSESSSETKASLSGRGKEIGSSSIAVACDGSAVEEDIVIGIGIRKKDGAFRSVDGTSEPPSEFVVTSPGGTEYKIKLVKATGRHYVEQ